MRPFSSSIVRCISEIVKVRELGETKSGLPVLGTTWESLVEAREGSVPRCVLQVRPHLPSEVCQTNGFHLSQSSLSGGRKKSIKSHLFSHRHSETMEVLVTSLCQNIGRLHSRVWGAFQVVLITPRRGVLLGVWEIFSSSYIGNSTRPQMNCSSVLAGKLQQHYLVLFTVVMLLSTLVIIDIIK